MINLSKNTIYSLGIIGGLGPKASSYFLKRLYQKLSSRSDNECPDIILLSMSSFPDRTQAILRKDPALTLKALNYNIEYLQRFPVSEIFIPCFTMHGIIRTYANQYADKLVMLDTLLLRLLERKKQKSLLLCTQGLFESGLFQASHNPYLVFPDATDRQNIHSMIYQVKRKGINANMLHFISELTEKYKVDSVVYGCTELHMLQELDTSICEWTALDVLEEISDLFLFHSNAEFNQGKIAIQNLADEKNEIQIVA